MAKSKGGKSPSRNDQKANTKNPTSPAHKAAADNKSNQGNSNNPAYHSSRGKK